jgi:ankyrin repeat protein
MPGKKKAGGKKKSAAKKAPLVIPPDDKLPVLANLKNSVIVNTISFADPQSVSRLIAHYDFGSALTTVDVNGGTPLHAAVRKDDAKMVQNLINYRTINIDALEIHAVGGQSALHLACLGGNTHIVDALLKGGANPNIKSDSTIGETPLQLCCKLGAIECGRLLIKAGAHPEAKDNFGNNASFWASKYRQDAIIRDLNLPPTRSPTADEFLALMIKQNPRFTLPTVKVKTKAKSKDGKGKKNKK